MSQNRHHIAVSHNSSSSDEGTELTIKDSTIDDVAAGIRVDSNIGHLRVESCQMTKVFSSGVDVSGFLATARIEDTDIHGYSDDDDGKAFDGISVGNPEDDRTTSVNIHNCALSGFGTGVVIQKKVALVNITNVDVDDGTILFVENQDIDDITRCPSFNSSSSLSSSSLLTVASS